MRKLAGLGVIQSTATTHEITRDCDSTQTGAVLAGARFRKIKINTATRRENDVEM